MTPDEELHLGMLDDPTPPDPDATRLGRVVARGRQRRSRRRALLGAVAGSVTLVLVGSGVAVAAHKDAGPQVQVQPAATTTTALDNAANVREGYDANGLHYTLTLTTPVVTAGADVRVTLHLSNPTSHVIVRTTCSFAINLVPPGKDHVLVLTGCQAGTFDLRAGISIDSEAVTSAPAMPGAYDVLVEPEASDVLALSLLKVPLEVRVLPNGGPTATTTTQPGSSSETLGPSQTTPPGNTTTYSPLSANPHAGDFTGTLIARNTATTVGHGVELSLTIRNATDHTLEGARGSLPNSVAIVCARDVLADGSTNQPLHSDENLFFVNAPVLAPGDSGTRSANFVPTADDIGTVTCEGVILATSAQWQDGTLSSIARLENIPPVTFAVTASAVDATTTTSTPASDTTTVPVAQP